MRKMGLWVCLVFLFVAMSAVGAEEPAVGAKDKKACSRGGGEKGSHQMKAMMMGKMMEKSMVATSDGGVVVLIGKKLIKYDKNLELKAEAEIKIDKAELKEMMKHCPMGQKKEAQTEEAEADAQTIPVEKE